MVFRWLQAAVLLVVHLGTLITVRQFYVSYI